MEKTAYNGAIELVLLRRRRKSGLRFVALIAVACAAWCGWLYYNGELVIPSSISTIWEFTLPGTATPTPGPRVKGQVTLPRALSYAIQLGAYNSRDEAQTEATTYVKRGAAGYVLFGDERSRVLGAVYFALDEAQGVLELLKNQEGIEGEIYEIKSEQVDMQITATQRQIDAMQRAINAYGDATVGMCALAYDLDRQTLETLGVKRQLSELCSQIRTAREELEGQIAGQSSAIASGLLTLMRDFESNLDNLSRFEGQSGMALSSQIKYNTIDRLIKRAQYVREITTEKA